MSASSNKILVLGDTGVGKTTLVNTLCGIPDTRPESTVGVNIQLLAHQFAAGTPQESTEIVELWDVEGRHIHKQTAVRVFSENVAGLILIHDLSNAKSEENLLQWCSLLEECAAEGMFSGNPQRFGSDFGRSPMSVDVTDLPDMPVLLVGSCADLAPQRQRQPFQPKLRLFRNYESVALDCRLPLAVGSTNRLLVNRFFDAIVMTRMRHLGGDLLANQRRRRLH